MIKKEIAPGIMVYSNVIDGYETLIDDIEEGMQSANLSWGKALVKSADEVKLESSSRNTDIISIPYYGKEIEDYSSLETTFMSSLSNLFLNSFQKYEEDYKATYGVVTTTHEQYSVLRYGIGQNFVNHVDDYPEGPRRVSTVYYMNDDYTGGEIEFPRFNIVYKPKANEMIAFPSNYVYNHSVHPVVEGLRYAVVGWMF